MPNLLKKLSKRFVRAQDDTPDMVKDYILLMCLKVIVLVGGMYVLSRVIEHIGSK